MKSSKDEGNRSGKNSGHKETELILRLKTGDQQAFTSLFYSYKDKLLRFVSLRIGAIEEAKDIVQDILLKIWLERENIDEQNNFNGYIFKIARNCVIDYLRKFSKNKIPVSDIISITVEENSENILLKKEKQLILQEAINHLPPQQKKIYRFHCEEGERLNNIAIKMEISLSAVQNHINKAIKNIRKHFVEKNYF